MHSSSLKETLISLNDMCKGINNWSTANKMFLTFT